MKPVAIFQHTPVGKPGAVLPVLDELGIPWVIVPMMDGAPVPERPDAYSGLILMGGSMGVNDGLPWLAQEVELVRRAAREGLPVAGHCLGSQIMASAFGAPVSRAPRMEIGWQPLAMAEGVPEAQAWFGSRPAGQVLQWHGDTFALPQGALNLASSPHCAQQAFVLDDRHLAMQFHLEMTPELVHDLLRANARSLERELAAGNPAVNDREDLLSDLEARTARMHEMLRHAYARWARGLSA